MTTTFKTAILFTRRGYVLHETHNRVLLCKILNEYDNLEQANNDLVKLLTHKTTEDDLLNDYDSKE